MTPNVHFREVADLREAVGLLAFEPITLGIDATAHPQSVRIHVRDHRRRDISINDRTLEVHYENFVFTQQARSDEEAARHQALDVSYGRSSSTAKIASHEGRVYELGPPVPPDDVDGREPAVVVWSDDRLVLLLASDSIETNTLVRIAESAYV
jgi:hypothetical protein